MPSLSEIEHRYPSIREIYADTILHEAETICFDGLARDPNQPFLLHLAGLLAARSAQYDFALACMQRAVSLEPRNAGFIGDLSDLLARSGRSADALGAALLGMTLAQGHAEGYRRVGALLAGQERFTEAAAMYQETLALAPTPQVLIALGDIRSAQGRHELALSEYRRSLELAPNTSDVYGRIAQIYLMRGEWRNALKAARDGLRFRPGDPALRTYAGEALFRAGSTEEALEEFRAALTAEPRHTPACRLLALGLELLGRTADAVGAWLCLGIALEAQGQVDDAAAAYRTVLARKPDCLTALVNLGQVCLHLAHPEEAARSLEAALRIDPYHRLAHVRLGWALDCLGDFPRAWREFRWYQTGERRRALEQPLWDGSALNGRTILLWADMGLGDAMRDVRCAPLVKARGGRVIVECHPDLAPLIEQSGCADRVVTTGAPVPAFDVHAPLLLLPGIMGTRRDTIPNAVPYLRVDPDLVKAWRYRLPPSEKRTIGLVWGCNPSHPLHRSRSIPLALFAALSGVPGVRFVSLQHGLQSRELVAPPPGLELLVPLDESCKIADKAALILNLDLTISVDTMAAHLAGAVGAPVWTLAPYSPASWLWHLDGEYSSWYPTMRVFRQTRRGDWRGVLKRVRTALEQFTSVNRLSAGRDIGQPAPPSGTETMM